MRHIRWIHIVLCTLIVAVAVTLRCCVFDIVTISDECCAPQLLPGDRVAVLRQAWCDSVPQRGDIVTFTHPAAPYCPFVGCVTAIPSDTLWIDSEGRLTTRSEAADLVVVPAKGQTLCIDRQSIRLYNTAIRQHEPVKSAIIDDALYVSGIAIDHYRFTQPYCWIAATQPTQDSRTLGLVPTSRITGKVLGVLYNHDPQQPLFKGWRWRR